MTIEKSEILAAISAVHVTEYPLGMVLADNVLNGIADAILPLLTDTASYRAGAEDMRERAAKAAELCAEENLNMAGDTILADPVISGRDYSDAAMEKSEALRIMGCGHSAAYHAGTDIAGHIRSLPLPDPQPTPTQESRDV